MKLSITFIHAADLHLGRVFAGLRHLPDAIYEKVLESGFQALENLIQTAIDHRVDFVLFAGDIFDSNTVSLRTYIRFREQMEKLKQHGIFAFICHGNHDPFEEHKQMIEWPENVTTFTEETVKCEAFTAKSGEIVHIYGFSYTKKQVMENKSGEFQKSGDAHFHIAMMHGNVEGQTEHDPYAPFSIHELIDKEFDYWALGHIHKRQILSMNPPIVYPGNIQGMNKKELGEKGCMLVTLTENEQASIAFIPTASIIWMEEAIDITNVGTWNELIENIEELKERHRKQNTFLLIRIIGSGKIHGHLQDRVEIEDLMWALNEKERAQETFVWIVDINVETTRSWDRDELRKRQDFIGELIQTLEHYSDFDDALKPLFNNRRIRTFLHAFSEEEKRLLLEKAEQLLLTKLLEEEKM